jgi:RNA polymerase sigma factor (sigma-70 family)
VIPFGHRSIAAEPTAARGEAADRMEGRLAHGELRTWLRGKLVELSPMAAEAFALRYFEEFTNTEIAEMLGTTQNSVAVILHRTRKTLSDQMRAEIGDEDE